MYANTENYVGRSLPGYPNLRPPRSLAELSNYGPSYSRHSSYSSTARSSSRTSISSTHSAQTSSLSGYSVEEENGPEPQRRSRQRYASSASQSSLSTLSTLSPLSSLSGSTLSAPSPLSRPSTVSAPSPLSSLSTLSAPSPLSRTSSTVSTSSRYSASSSSTATLCDTSLESKDPDWQLCSDYYVAAVLRNVDLLAHVKIETPGLPRFPARIIQMGGRNHLTGKPRLLSLYECGLKSARRNMLVPPDERVFASEPWNKPLIFKLTVSGIHLQRSERLITVLAMCLVARTLYRPPL